MVKNSKLILVILCMMVANSALAQMSIDSKSALERDMEISRITLVNYLEKWESPLLLNRIEDCQADFEDGNLIFTVDSPYADVFMRTNKGYFANADTEVIETFYTKEVVELQQKRLLTALVNFLKDYSTFLPDLEEKAYLTFVFEMSNNNDKDSNSSLKPYSLEVSWNKKKIDALLSNNSGEESILASANIKKQ